MTQRKLNVAILFGGKSAEHEVSLQSAKNVLAALDKDKYHPILIGIGKDGLWRLHDSAAVLLQEKNPALTKLNSGDVPVALTPQSNGKMLTLGRSDSAPTVDVVFPVLHGPFGEDGTVQGMLKLANVPFVGAGVLGSAVGMDKDVMKRLLRDADIPIGRFLVLKKNDSMPFDAVVKELGLPFFVKPANLGSSVGISKVKTERDFANALATAFRFDRKVLLEEYIDGREIECAVLGNDNPAASVPGEIVVNDEFYSYEAKYVDENGARLEIPANIPPETTRTIQQLAVRTFTVLACEGMARVDFFLKKNKEVLINEINTIPGFTAISMYPRLWNASGVTYMQLVDRLIQLAIERFEKERRLRTTLQQL